jgi:AraC-like DNA-binding protein
MQRDDIRLWKDQNILGGMEMLNARCVTHRYPPHSHEVFVIAAFRDGVQRHKISGHSGVAYPGTVMIIPPGEVHTAEGAKRDSAWEYSAFYPSAEGLESLSWDLFGDRRGSLDFGTELLIEDAQLAAAMLAASDVAGRSHDVVEREEAIYSAFGLMIGRYGQRTTGGEMRPPADAPIQDALDFIHQNYDQPLKLKEIALAVNLSEFHFMRVFKSRMGMTAHRYLTQVRLNAAKSLLAAGQSTVDIAIKVGFYDQSHMTKKFRDCFGVTPHKFASACC